MFHRLPETQQSCETEYPVLTSSHTFLIFTRQSGTGWVCKEGTDLAKEDGPHAPLHQERHERYRFGYRADMAVGFSVRRRIPDHEIFNAGRCPILCDDLYVRGIDPSYAVHMERGI